MTDLSFLVKLTTVSGLMSSWFFYFMIIYFQIPFFKLSHIHACMVSCMVWLSATYFVLLCMLTSLSMKQF